MRAKLLKLALVGLGLLFALFLIGLTFSGDWEAKATVTIQAKPELIYEDVANLRNWRLWSVWNDEADPDCKHEYEGPDSGVGAKWKWDGPKLLTGVMTNTEASVEKGIEYELEFAGMATSFGAVEFDAKGDQTIVNMKLKGVFEGAFGGWLSMLIPGAMEAEFQQCLDGLKARVEQRAKARTVDANYKKK